MNDELLTGFYWAESVHGFGAGGPEVVWLDAAAKELKIIGYDMWMPFTSETWRILEPCVRPSVEEAEANSIIHEEIAHSHAMIEELVAALIGLMQRNKHHDGEIKTDSGIFAYAAAKAAVAKATGVDCPS